MSVLTMYSYVEMVCSLEQRRQRSFDSSAANARRFPGLRPEGDFAKLGLLQRRAFLRNPDGHVALICLVTLVMFWDHTSKNPSVGLMQEHTFLDPERGREGGRGFYRCKFSDLMNTTSAQQTSTCFGLAQRPLTPTPDAPGGNLV